MDTKAHNDFYNAMAQVVLGTKPWISLTQAARATGICKYKLEEVAKRLGLTVKNSGRRGLTAYTAAVKVATPSPRRKLSPYQ